MHLVRAAAIAALSLFMAVAAYAQTTAADQSAPAAPDVPDNVRSDGSFTDFIPFDIPEYRGLEPELGLSYRSSFNGRGVPEAYLGAGWQLTGFSSIERVAERGGIPTYSDGDDIFRLDGEDLMACADTGATNPWPTDRAYSANFRTESVSASCSSGGNLSTRIESFLKIEMKQETYNNTLVDYFIVTRTDGTQLRYTSIGVLAANTTTATNPIYPALFKRKWLLTEIRDTQATPNVVTFSYGFEAATKGLAHYPSRVSYGGYTIDFSYNFVINPRLTYAVGVSGAIGQSHNSLRWVTVREGATKIRAYAFTYGSSASTNTALLTRISTFGNNFVEGTPGQPMTGTELSGQRTFSYSADTVSVGAAQSYSGVKFGPRSVILDVDQDGRDEVLQSTKYADGTLASATRTYVPPRNSGESPSYTPENTAGSCAVGPTVGTFGFDGSGALSQSALPAGVIAAEESTGTFLGLTSLEPVSGKHYAIFGSSTHNPQYCGSQGNDCGSSSSSIGVLPIDGTSRIFVASTGGVNSVPPPPTVLFGNFDSDAAPEAYIATGGGALTFRQISDSTATADGTSVNGSQLTGGVSFDTNGDGRDERLTLPTNATVPTITFARRLNGAGFSSPAITIPNPLYQVTPALAANTSLRYGIGDLNGDDSDDLVIWNISGSAADQIYVAIGNGRGFEKATLWATPALNLTASANTRARLLVRDVNGDHLDDIILDAGQNTAGSNCGTYPTEVFISSGNTLQPTAPLGIVSLANVGDLDGDGLLDFLSVGADGAVRYGTGGIPNLLTTIVDASGGETRISYVSHPG